MRVAVPGDIRDTPDNHAVEPTPNAFAVPRDSTSATNRTRSASNCTIRARAPTARVTATNSASPSRHASTPPGSANTSPNSMHRTLVRSADNFRAHSAVLGPVGN